MVKKRFSFTVKLLIVVILAGLIFGIVPTGRAQSVQEWSEPVNLSNSGSASSPSLVVDSDGHLYAIWVDEFDGYEYADSADGGVTWTAPLAVKFPFSRKGAPPVLLS